jgi:DNA-binding CsgD family transcriptional regulator
MSTPAPIHHTNGSRVLSTAGLILVDCSHKLLYYSAEAMRVLTYPEHLRNPDGVTNFLPKKIQAWLLGNLSTNHPWCVADFTSGKRHYVCRAFTLADNSERPSGMTTAFLIERSAPKLSAAAEYFCLTQREQEVVALLTLGLTSKEIAIRMNISPNTVKTFFRLIMTKMAVSTRSGVVGKIAHM